MDPDSCRLAEEGGETRWMSFEEMNEGQLRESLGKMIERIRLMELEHRRFSVPDRLKFLGD